MQEALVLLRGGDMGVAVTTLLADKYNCNEREARDWVARARKLLDAETADMAEAWRSEIIAGTAEAYRLAKQRKNVAMMLAASAQLWRMTGNEHRQLDPARPATPIDVSRLTPTERAELRALMVKALPPPPIEVTETEDDGE